MCFLLKEKIVDFETCEHRKVVEVLGIECNSVFCDIDDTECDEYNGKCRNIDKI